MANEKLSPKLTEALQNSSAEGPLDVVVELQQPAPVAPAGTGRAEQIAARKEAFSKGADAIAGQILSLGGEVTGQAWINNTIRARLTKTMVSALSEAPHVKALDVPHQLQADASE